MLTARIKDATAMAAEIEVRWADDAPPSRFSNVWLRDHCHSQLSLHPETMQRQVDTFAIPADLGVESVAVEEDGARLHIRWARGAGASDFPAGFLRQIAETSGKLPKPERRLWDRAALGNSLPSTPYADIMASDEGLFSWLQQILVYGFAIATDTPPTPEATQALCERIAYIRQTIFGGFWDFTADLAFKDTAYTPLAIGPHTDGTYSNDPPGLQMLHCLKFEGTGAQNTLVDGFKIGEVIRDTDPEAFEILTTVKIPAHYDGDGVSLRAAHPIIELDAEGDICQVAYNNYDRAPFQLKPERQMAFYRALALWNRMINDASFEIQLDLRPGGALMFDNWRVLHGRHEYTGYRRLCGAYLNQEDFQSKLRILSANR